MGRQWGSGRHQPVSCSRSPATWQVAISRARRPRASVLNPPRRPRRAGGRLGPVAPSSNRRCAARGASATRGRATHGRGHLPAARRAARCDGRRGSRLQVERGGGGQPPAAPTRSGEAAASAAPPTRLAAVVARMRSGRHRRSDRRRRRSGGVGRWHAAGTTRHRGDAPGGGAADSAARLVAFKPDESPRQS